MHGMYIGRNIISTSSYLARNATTSRVWQEISSSFWLDSQKQLNSLTFSGSSKFESGNLGEELEWTLKLQVTFTNTKQVLESLCSFDPHHGDWQTCVTFVCLSPWASIESINVIGQFSGKGGSVLWDDWALLSNIG
jgi:hypothetical protein